MKPVSVEQAVAMIPEGASVMIGGFMGVGTPERLLDELVRQHKSGLSIIANDAAIPGKGIGKLFDTKLVASIVASHIGLNPKVQQQMMEKSISVDLVPQGTLIERIRAGGFGLGGVLTRTGLGTLAENGKQRIEVDGKAWLLETPLAITIRPGPRLSGRPSRQPFVCAYGAQLQSGDRHGGRYGHRHRRPYRTGRRHRPRSRRDAGATGRLPRHQRVKPWTHRPSLPGA